MHIGRKLARSTLWVALALLPAVASPGASRPAAPAGSEEAPPGAFLDAGAAEAAPRSAGPAPPRWLLGKIEPAVEKAARDATELDVILYMVPSFAAGTGTSPEAVREGHLPAIRELGRRIRDIGRQHLPGPSLPEDEEKLWARLREASVSDADHSRLRGLRMEMDRRLDAMRAAVGRAVRERAALTLDAATEAIELAGGRVNARIPLVAAVGATIPVGSLMILAGQPEVAAIVMDRPPDYELNVSVTSLGLGGWWVDDGSAFSGTCGGTWDGGLVDTGVQEDHPAFLGINFYTDGTNSDTDGHGTHVAGIIASRDHTYAGMAPCLDSIVWGKSGGQSTTMSRMDIITTTLAESPEVINHSLGYGTANVLDYNTNDGFYDAFIQAFDVMVSKSAGNGGWNDSVPTITHPAPAFNLMAVANMNDRNTFDRGDDVRSSSSSVGPTFNGRRKPDIAAPGTDILSANAFWPTDGSGGIESCRNPSSHNDFVSCSGTSMAAPHITGAIVLLEDAGNHDPAAQKAVLINTADWWESNNTSTTSDDGPRITTSGAGTVDWDKSYGWGYLDMGEAAFHAADYFTGTLVPRNDTNVEDDYKLYRGPMLANERATLVWEKRAVYLAGIAPTTVYALSDLNIRLYDEADGLAGDEDLDSDDNVHQVAAIGATDAVIKVYSQSSTFDGASTEAYALATEENFQQVDFPDLFQGLSSLPATVQPNEEFDLSFWVRNDSVLTSHLNQFDLRLPAGWSLVAGADPAGAGSAPGGGGTSGTVVWTVRAQATPGPAAELFAAHTHSSYDESYGPFDWKLEVGVVEDVTAPTPDPLTWSSAPFALDTSQIQMQVTTATDAHGPVEYEFDFTMSPTGGPGGTDSAWQTSTVVTGSGLGTNDNYCYQARARDNPTTTPNTTGFTVTSCAYTSIETPTGVTFGIITADSIQASSSNTPSGLRRDLSGLLILNESAGTDSGWQQDNNFWTSGGLSPNTTYAFQAQARNGDAVPTPLSPTGARYTLANVPLAQSLSVVTDASIHADWSLNGNPAGTEFFAENSTTGTGSGWTTSTSWENDGLTCGSTYGFRVKARNGDGVETVWVSLGSLQAGLDFDQDGDPDCLDPDDDNDAVTDPNDCAPFDAGLWTVPSEARNLRLTHVPGLTSLFWDAPSSPGGLAPPVYDTVVSEQPFDLTTTAACVETDDGSDQVSVHGPDPGLGEAFHYVIRPGNGCGEGPPGFDSSDALRVALSCP